MVSIVEKSVAYSALGRTTKRVYRVICDEIARSTTGSAPITAATLMAAINSNSTAAIAAATRELRGLGFIVTTIGHRGVSVFELADGWQAITDPVEAKRLAAAARVVEKRKPLTRSHVRTSRKPVDVPVDTEEPEPEQPRVRAITLPVLAWPSQAGLRLLAENPVKNLA